MTCYFPMNFRDAKKVGIVHRCALYTAEYVILFFHEFQDSKKVHIVHKYVLYTAGYVILFFHEFQGCKEG